MIKGKMMGAVVRYFVLFGLLAQSWGFAFWPTSIPTAEAAKQETTIVANEIEPINSTENNLFTDEIEPNSPPAVWSDYLEVSATFNKDAAALGDQLKLKVKVQDTRTGQGNETAVALSGTLHPNLCPKNNDLCPKDFSDE